MPSSWKWFAVKTVYRTVAAGRPEGRDADFDAEATLVEERIVLLRARSHDEATQMAEAEGDAYAADRHVNPYGQRVTTRRLGGVESFEPFDAPGKGTEIWSHTRVVPSRVPSREVLDQILGPKELRPGRRRKFLDCAYSGSVRPEIGARPPRGPRKRT